MSSRDFPSKYDLSPQQKKIFEHRWYFLHYYIWSICVWDWPIPGNFVSDKLETPFPLPLHFWHLCLALYWEKDICVWFHWMMTQDSWRFSPPNIFLLSCTPLYTSLRWIVKLLSPHLSLACYCINWVTHPVFDSSGWVSLASEWKAFFQCVAASNWFHQKSSSFGHLLLAPQPTYEITPIQSIYAQMKNTNYISDCWDSWFQQKSGSLNHR